MRISHLIAIAAASVLAIGASAPVDARASKAKVQRADKAKAAPVQRRVASTARRSVARADSALPDRTTIYHANGRLNGQALFDSISERTSGAGE